MAESKTTKAKPKPKPKTAAWAVVKKSDLSPEAVEMFERLVTKLGLANVSEAVVACASYLNTVRTRTGFRHVAGLVGRECKK